MEKWGNDEIAEFQSFLARNIKAGHQVHLLEDNELGEYQSPSISNDLFTFSRHNIGMIVGVALFPPKIEFQVRAE